MDGNATRRQWIGLGRVVCCEGKVKGRKGEGKGKGKGKGGAVSLGEIRVGRVCGRLGRVG